MATRHCYAFGLSLLALSGLFSAPAVAELRPVKAWQCTIAAPDAQAKTESPRDRKITLYEYRSPDNCLENASPPDGTYVCRADYTKDGATETLWRARNNRGFCRPRTEALVQDLDKAGFFCTALEVEGCDEPATRTDEIKTPTAGTVRNVASVDKTASREQKLVTFFNGLFDASLAKAMTDAAIPGTFAVYDDSTLSAGNGETLRFTRGTHAWETRRDAGVLVINADFQHGTSFNDVFFGFTFDRSSSTNETDRYQIQYLGVVSPETASEVIYAGEDKIIISSKWYAESRDCHSSRTTDEHHWSDSIYGTLQMRTISVVDNPDCVDE